MSQWMVLYGKEMLEMKRSGKWLWVPVVFVLLGVMNPISSYYMPQILDMAGGMPEGTVIQIPVPTAAEVMAKTLSQYGTLGLLILVLAFMGIVSGERVSGAAAMILVKPVRYGSYISAKWAGMLTLTGASFLIGYGASWYYTEFLIGHLEATRAVGGFAVYGLWLSFVMTLTLFMSAWLRGNGAIAFVTLFLAAVFSILTGLFSRYAGWSPARLADHANAYLAAGKWLPSFPWTVTVTLLLIAAMVYGSARIFRKQEFPD